MRFLKFMIIILLFVGAIGYGVYHFGLNIASEKVSEKITTELEKTGQLEEVKKFAMQDPQVRQFVEEGAAADEKSLPFTTKEQATKVLVQKVGIRQLMEIQQKAQRGMTASEQAELLKEVETKLTEEEIAALKYVLYKELSE